MTVEVPRFFLFSSIRISAEKNYGGKKYSHLALGSTIQTLANICAGALVIYHPA
jgi:hypothetical protein